MIEQSVKVHDKHQAELKLDYKLESFDAVRSYEFAAYLFIPPSLGINPRTYSKNDFYNDVVSHIRIKTPSYPLRTLATGAGGPLERLRAAITALVEAPGAQAVSDYEYHLKMFCCVVKSALRDHVNAARARRTAADLHDLVAQYLTGVAALTSAFRGLRSLLNTPTVEAELFSKYLFADEYVSLIVESNTYELVQTVDRVGSEVAQLQRPKLLELARGELAFRREAGYPSIPDPGSDNEMLVFRKSVLKKYVENVLFLVTRTQREGTLFEQSVYAVAAGVSMIFATAIAFLTQRRYGNFTLAFFVALVISYMFKDRLKEVLRVFLATKTRRLFFDRRLRIYDDPKERDRIGRCREACDFLNERRVPPAVWRLRSRDHLTEIENGWLGETVIQYRKQITLFPEWFRRARESYRVEGINDIIRLNFARYLVRMDDPKKPLWVCDGTDCHQTFADRVYHVNMILECRMGRVTEHGRFRIVLNKDGIKRIEAVASEQLERGGTAVRGRAEMAS
jgi:hypothetical protein